MRLVTPWDGNSPTPWDGNSPRSPFARPRTVLVIVRRARTGTRLSFVGPRTVLVLSFFGPGRVLVLSFVGPGRVLVLSFVGPGRRLFAIAGATRRCAGFPTA